MKQIAGLGLGLIILVSVLSCQSNKRANNYNKQPAVDQREEVFLKNAAEASNTFVKISGLAISNSKDQQVLQFAKMMIDGHTQLAADLQKLQTDNFVIPTDSISTAHQQIIDNLGKRRAAEFDKAYLQEIINKYEPEIKQYDFAGQYKSSNIADFAQKALPALKAHLDSAKAISVALK